MSKDVQFVGGDAVRPTRVGNRYAVHTPFPLTVRRESSARVGLGFIASDFIGVLPLSPNVRVSFGLGSSEVLGTFLPPGSTIELVIENRQAFDVVFDAGETIAYFFCPGE